MMSSSAPLKLSALELDALRETGNVGAGRAATALSQMLGRPVGIDVPRVAVIRLEELPAVLGGPEAIVAATYFRIHGDAPGRLVMLLGESSLVGVLGAMLGRPLVAGAPLSNEALSALKELGNIICSNYLNAVADLVGFPILPSVPALAIDMASSVLESVAADAAQHGAQALLLENRFHDWGQPVPIYLFYLPETGALEALLAGMARNTGVDPRGGRG